MKKPAISNFESNSFFIDNFYLSPYLLAEISNRFFSGHFDNWRIQEMRGGLLCSTDKSHFDLEKFLMNIGVPSLAIKYRR